MKYILYTIYPMTTIDNVVDGIRMSSVWNFDKEFGAFSSEIEIFSEVAIYRHVKLFFKMHNIKKFSIVRELCKKTSTFLGNHL